MTDVLAETNGVVSVAKLREVLEETEGLEERAFAYGPSFDVKLEYRPDDKDNKLIISLGGEEYGLNGESAAQIFKVSQIPQKLLEAVPLELTLPILNWFLKEEFGELKALIKNNRVLAFTAVSTDVVPAVDILDEALNSLDVNYNVNESEVLVDNISHDLSMTEYTLIVPDAAAQLDNGDVLNSGVHIQSSILGTKPLLIQGYVGRDYHHNGSLSEDLEFKFKKKPGRKVKDLDEVGVEEGDHTDILDFVHDAVASAYKNSPNEVGKVKLLANMGVGSHSGTFLVDLATRYKLPTKLLGLVREEYANQDETQMYNLWCSISQAAKRDELVDNPQGVRKLMETAGGLAAHPSTCNTCHRGLPDA